MKLEKARRLEAAKRRARATSFREKLALLIANINMNVVNSAILFMSIFSLAFKF